MDHINVATFLRQLQRAGAAEAGRPPSSSSSAAAAAAAAAAGRAVELQVGQLAAAATEVARIRAKWFDPRYSALVVSRTARLGHTDGRVLHLLTNRVLARLGEAYSRDLHLLLRGLHAHSTNMRTTTMMERNPTSSISSNNNNNGATRIPAATPPSPSDGSGGGGGGGAAAASGESQQRRRPSYTVRRLSGGRCRPTPAKMPPRPLTPYRGPPPRLLAGVEAFMLGRLPSGRMPPESVDGILRYTRALSGRPVGPDLCAAAVEDLHRRLPIYAPGPLAGLLSTLAAERHPLPPDLLDAAAGQFAAHAATRASGAAAARFLAAAAAALHRRNTSSSSSTAPTTPPAIATTSQEQQQQQAVPVGGPSTAGAAAGAAAAPPAAEGPGEWIAARMELLAECLGAMARDLPGASPDQLRLWLQALARVEAPLGALAASAAAASPPLPSPPLPAAAAAGAAAAAFVRAHAAATERALPGLAAEAVARMRAAYDAVGLPYPRGL